MDVPLALFGGPPTLADPPPHYRWPPVTAETRAAVLEQLETALSIKDRSGVIRRFEQRFADYHGRRFALLTNSGTSALFAVFEGLGLQPGDEVLCPEYTWFATASAMMYTGATPVFCDCGQDCNIDPAEVEARLGPRTRALVVTHMWGKPCAMDRIAALCADRGLALVEDCSHAHGATFRGRTVGTFGTAAVWSLQAAKLVAAGEGGILLTDDENVYARAQLQGHYNRRCEQEIDAGHSLYRFWQTGFGQKLRIHPLAAAIAEQQFGHLEEWLAQKRAHARYMCQQLKDLPLLHLPANDHCEPSWYVFALRYDHARAGGVTVDEFVEALHAEGLAEVDRPGLTGPVSRLPLFREPEVALPRLYRNSGPLPDHPGGLPVARAVYDSILTLPVWATAGDRYWVERYVDGIRKVAGTILAGRWPQPPARDHVPRHRERTAGVGARGGPAAAELPRSDRAPGVAE